MKKEKKKVVILGGGFGGLYTYKGLYKHFKHDELDITVVNRTNYFLFTPMLHEVATGGLAHHQIVESIRQVIYKTNDKLHVAELVSIDCDKRIVKTTIGELPYDILVVALGATTNFFDTPGACEHAFVLKNLHDAIKLRNTLIETFEKASEITDEEARRKALSFAVVGGGATGVELVAEITELYMTTFLKYYHGLIKTSDIPLYLVNRGPELLAPFHPSLRKKALKILSKNKVRVLLNTGVKEVKENGILLDNDTFLDVGHVVWAAGVKPNSPMFIQDIPLDKNGKVIVNSTLQLSGHPEVFVLGDMASIDSNPMPMLAQIAERQGLHTGLNISKLVNKKRLIPFEYKLKGELASLGQWNAVANIYGIKISGPVAWFLWRTVYLFKFLSTSKRVKIAIDWTMNIFYPRDITKA